MDINIFKLLLMVCIISSYVKILQARKLRSVDNQDTQLTTNSVEYIWSTTTVALGDTAVLHCSFDAIFQQLQHVKIDWHKGQINQPANKNKTKSHQKRNPKDINSNVPNNNNLHHHHNHHQQQPHHHHHQQQQQRPIQQQKSSLVEAGEWELTGAIPIASGKKMLVDDSRYKVFRPPNSALSVLIIRRTKKKDAGIYRCNLARSTTRHRYMILNVTESKIEAQTSPTVMRAKAGNEVTLWCNATGYPKPVVYWMRKDSNRPLPDGSNQFWGNGLQIKSASEMDTGVYECFLDNFVQPIVNYRFTLMIEGSNPWKLDGYKMRFDSNQWYPIDSDEPTPVRTKAYLLMCETRGANKQVVIKWYKDGKQLQNTPIYYIIKDSPETKGSYASSTLVIIKYEHKLNGDYTCVAYGTYRIKKLTFSLKAQISNTEDKDEDDIRKKNDDDDDDDDDDDNGRDVDVDNDDDIYGSYDDDEDDELTRYIQDDDNDDGGDDDDGGDGGKIRERLRN